MDFRDTPEEAAFRASVRAFIGSELPPDLRGGSSDEDAEGRFGGWLQKLRDHGWIAPAWPKEYGGGGASIVDQFILNEEMARARAPRPSGVAIGFVGPTIITYGTDEQKARFLPGILQGDQWCQGFSEPGAGSDLAALQTRAERDGDDYVVNGQKIWTSLAHRAQWMIMLARTDRDAPKHRGISCFILDMKTPGISVRPLENMAGTHEFNEVFFDNVRIPAQMRIGDENRGWYVGMTTLEFERSHIGAAVGLERNVADVLAAARDLPGGRRRTAGLRMEVTDRAIEIRVATLMSHNVFSLQKNRRPIEHEASTTKLFVTELTQRVFRTGMRVLGLYGLARADDLKRMELPLRYVPGQYLYSVQHTIAGGTSEIVRGVIATRSLGLPRS
jgi:alkylation response protein AidB-like acyl-CoA dehydrogenase